MKERLMRKKTPEDIHKIKKKALEPDEDPSDYFIGGLMSGQPQNVICGIIHRKYVSGDRTEDTKPVLHHPRMGTMTQAKQMQVDHVPTLGQAFYVHQEDALFGITEFDEERARKYLESIEEAIESDIIGG